ncbi:hypothetical protein WJ32_08565 [Burkholderia ubonensis]|uniref:Phage lipoprotein n=1 Tax=Burkholderia ubonensis TaxID=101571 RepID=A0A103QVQ5_9BURK|nr:hypothetical protein [Burkholderia ubonensis]AOJ62506.1 hypothetical protein WJ32_08565 [Burkholderia ubonensis]KVG56469.1 hypothetical protein WJ33_37230 [Burkholderia ubonensis]
MKKTLMLLAAGVVAFLAGCAGTPGAAQSPAQIAARACPLLTDEISTLAQAGLFTGGAQATLTGIVQPAVDKACAAGTTVTQLDLQTLSAAAVPALIDLVKLSGLPDADKTKAILAIGTAKAMLDTALAVLAPPAPVAPAPVSTPASTPLTGSTIQ